MHSVFFFFGCGSYSFLSGFHLLLRGVVSWDTIDVVLFPVNLKKNHHWILIVFDIVDRSLTVYDSFPKRGKDYEVSNVVEKFSAMLPLYLAITKFYEKRSDLLSSEKYSKLKATDRLDIKMLTNQLPKQKEDSLL